MIAFILMHDEHVTLNNNNIEYIDYQAIDGSEFCEFYNFWALNYF